MNDPTPQVAPETLTEAAGRSAAALTTRLLEAHSRLPLGHRELDPATLQSTLALAFQQGANWAMDRAIQLAMAQTKPINRRAV